MASLWSVSESTSGHLLVHGVEDFLGHSGLHVNLVNEISVLSGLLISSPKLLIFTEEVSSREEVLLEHEHFDTLIFGQGELEQGSH